MDTTLRAGPCVGVQVKVGRGCDIVDLAVLRVDGQNVERKSRTVAGPANARCQHESGLESNARAGNVFMAQEIGSSGRRALKEGTSQSEKANEKP